MPSKQFVITSVHRQGWREPGGGVVLETDLYCTRFMYLTCTSRCLCRGLYYYLYDFGILGDDYISWGSHFVCMCRPCRRSLGKLLWMSSGTLSVERCYLLELALIMFTHSLMILFIIVNGNLMRDYIYSFEPYWTFTLLSLPHLNNLYRVSNTNPRPYNWFRELVISVRLLTLQLKFISIWWIWVKLSISYY